jgi:hypothetical protein
MHRQGNLFLSGILIVLAVLLLLKQAGLIVGDIFGYFWPLLIIVIGIWLITGFFVRNRPVEGEKVSIPLENATSAYIKLDHGAGRLSLHSGAGTNEIINGTFANGLNYKSHMEGNRIEVKLRSSHQFWAWLPGESLDWDVHLNQDILLNLKIDSGVSASTLDLSDLKVADLDIDIGASSTDLTVPANAGNTHVEIDTGASSLKINIPVGVAASIRIKSGIAAVNVNSRFPRQEGGLYQSADYGSSANRVDMTVNAGVGSIDIN